MLTAEFQMGDGDSLDRTPPVLAAERGAHGSVRSTKSIVTAFVLTVVTVVTATML